MPNCAALGVKPALPLSHLIEAVALGEASLERARLQFEAGVNRGVAVFRAQIRIGHHERPLVS